MAINPPSSTLSAIEIKVRRLTRSPSTAQLSQQDLDDYINNFILYDFPEHLRLFDMRSTFTFYTNPFQDEYPTDTASFGTNPSAQTNPLYNFQNLYISVHEPLYIAGYQSLYTQSREQFFGIYPKVNNISSIGVTGDGITTTFTGVINSQQAIVSGQTSQLISLLQNQVLFSTYDSSYTSLAMIDVPVLNPNTGNPFAIGNLYVPGQTPTTPPTVVTPTNFINYVTGQFTVTFTAAPAVGAAIDSQTVPQQPTLPQAMLFYDNKFIVRPVPDQAYRVQFEVYKRPTALLASNVGPQLEQWWQYIALGAARKILIDRLDTDTVALIEPEYNNQRSLVLRKTLVELANERVATVYTEQTSFGPGSGAWGWGGGPF